MAQTQADEQAIFEVARKIDSRESRNIYLQQMCGDDAALQQRVAALLRAYEESESFLESPPPGLEVDPSQLGGSPTIDCPITEAPGTIIGPYKLLQQIGEGGMGVVFMAEQTEPLQRTVALKIIKPGMDTRQVIARFEAERQALAMMDHPNIAKVLDAGTTEEGVRSQVSGVSEEKPALSLTPDTRHLTPTSGRPYFVMDLVKGIPITDYCDQQHLTIRQRLELMTQVCHAVQHAHQKGIIHRDLKPSNVLVAEYDGKPVPKIIDFGVAKATAQRLTERTMFTEYGQLIGTFEYMSPEQARFNQLDVDTRSDIYSLGVLLYELLTGETPFDRQRLHSASFEEVLRIIREEEPPRPSTRLSSLSHGERAGVRDTAKRASTIAEHRSSDRRQLTGVLRGELDWIVMKCLEKDRNRRYESSSSLARDIERYLSDEPVQACPPSASYRFRKFARRNKTLLAAGGAIAAALVIGLGVAAWQYLHATTESARAKAVSDLLQEMLGSANAGRAKGVDYKVRELLDEFSTGLGSRLTGQPEVKADIHATIAHAYRSLMLPAQAQPHFEKAIELRRRIDGPQSEKLATILVDYGWNLHDELRFSDAESQLQEALQIYRRRGITGGPVIHALTVLQHVLISSGRDDDAERVTQQALSIASQSAEDFPDQANLLHRYADLKIRHGRFAEGETLAQQAVDMHRRLHGDHHPETGWALHTLVTALRPQQKLAEAERAMRESLAIFRRCFSEEDDNVRQALGDLKSVLKARGDQSALETLVREERERDIRLDSPDYHVHLAELLATTNPVGDARMEEARRQIRRAIEGYGRLAASDGNSLNQRLTALERYLEVARVCAAVPALASELDELNRILQAECADLLTKFPDPANTVDTLYCFALARLRLGDQAGYRQACEAMLHVPDADGDDEMRRTWIWCLAPHAIEELSIPLSTAEKTLANHTMDSRHTELQMLAGLLYRAGRYEEAARRLEEFTAAYPTNPGPGESTINYQRLLLAMTKWQQRQKDEARRLLAEAQRAVDEELQSSSISWNRRATLEVLRGEAEALIESKEADEAANKDNPTPVVPPNPEP